MADAIALSDKLIRLGEFQSQGIVELATRDPGVYEQPLSIVGNSLLSTLFVAFLDPGASVTVEYYDYGVGGDQGEHFPLPSHGVITEPSLIPDRVLVTNIHDKPVLRATVTGGRALFGVYMTVVTASATDIDNALQREKDPVAVTSDKGIPIVVYDEANGVWRFARGELGIQDVRIVGNVAVGEPGTALFMDYAGETTPGLEQVYINYTVPQGYKLNLLSVQLVCARETSFQILGDGEMVGSGRTAAGVPQVNFAYRIARTFGSGKIVQVKGTTRAHISITDVECYLQGTLSMA